MSGDTLGLIFTAATCTAAATTFVVVAIKGVEKALALHAADDAITHKDQEKRIVSLEAWRKKGRK